MKLRPNETRNELTTQLNDIALFTNFSSGSKGWEIDSSFLIQELIPADSVIMFNAPSQSYKTFILISLSISLCLGQNYGPLQVTRKYSNFIFSAEGNSGLKRRIRAASIAAGVDDVPNLHSDSGAYDFMDIVTIKKLANDINAIAVADGNPVGITAIDTFSAHTNIDENNSAQVAQFLKNCSLLSELTGGSVFVVHHTGKDRKSYRGSYAFEANVDAMIDVKCKKVDSMQAEVSVLKMKDGSSKPHLFLNLQSAELGINDAYGKPVTSLFVENVQLVTTSGKSGTIETVKQTSCSLKKSSCAPLSNRNSDSRHIISKLQTVGNWVDSAALSKSLSEKLESPSKSTLNSRFFRAMKYLVSAKIVDKKGQRQNAMYRLTQHATNDSNYQLPLPLTL